ncbi:His/Gly/Thr/Pro-type tRNA ligase C-terminal domain-containing protein [Amycolatopsis azurea]
MTVLGAEDEIVRLAGQLRARGLRTGVYLGSSGKLAKQLKWAADQHARWVLLFGPDEQAEAVVTVRDMVSGEQTQVPIAEVAVNLAERAASAS